MLSFGRIGDAIALTPALRALRRAAPSATIEIVTTSAGGIALSANPNIDAIHVLRLRRGSRWINMEKARLVRRLRQRDFDTVFLFETAPRYHALASSLNVERTFAFAPPGEPGSDSRVCWTDDLHRVANHHKLLARAGVPDAGTHYDFPISSEAKRRAEALFARYGISDTRALVGLHAGQFQRHRHWRRKRHSKAWPAERFARVIRQLADRGASRVILSGAADERSVADAIMGQVPGGLAVNLAGATDLQTLGAVIHRCALFISTDTGPAHIATAVGTPLIGLFGPTSPDIMGPLGDEPRIERIYLDGVSLPSKEREGYHPRMWAIQVEHVMEAVSTLGISFG